MSVYVDDMEAPFGRLIMCHMFADSTEELLAMVDYIGVKRKWIQKAGTVYEHFDICKAKRKLAVEAGAKEVTWRDYGLYMRAKRLSQKVFQFSNPLPSTAEDESQTV